MMRATDLAHLLVRQSLKPGDWAVDATVGNGHDLRFLAQIVGPSGRVFGFDVQESALGRAAALVRGAGQVTFVKCGHERMAERLPIEAKGRLGAVMFNLGYLPGGAKDVATLTDTTLCALEQALSFINTGGIVTLVLYRGHPGGEEEAEAVALFAQRLPVEFAAHRYARLNALRRAPELVVIERLNASAGMA